MSLPQIDSPTETTAAASRSSIRERAVAFSGRFAHVRGEQAERQTFWNEFFAVFGIDRLQVAVFEKLGRRSTTGGLGYIDLLYPGQLGVEHKSRGEDLGHAMDQLLDYLPGLTPAQQPWLLVACDFQTFAWQDLLNERSGEFALAELADNLDLFFWLAGYQRPGERYENEEEANLKATELLADLHDRLRTNGYEGHPLREWMTRILFCLFADDTGVWERAAFHARLALHTRSDGSDLGPAIAYLFQILNTPPDARPRQLDEEIAQFTYIDGDLFAEQLPIPACDEEIREALLEACRFDWGAISPAIFGSMFQNVMEPAARRQLGGHYTTEANILRTIRPLFLDELEAELETVSTRPRLRSFLNKLAELSFFDPACGCGNFLVVAYRELRRLESEALRRLRDRERRAGQLTIDITIECNVRVDQFYGIEIEEFPAKIARTALYLIDHLSNRAVSAEFGQHYVRFPIPAAPHIVIGNALRIDWSSVLDKRNADFVLGNPPYVGKKARTTEQRDDMVRVFGGDSSLDYVAAWYQVAARYIDGTNARVAFVSTNSITQGEQVPLLWPRLLEHGFTIGFAHRTFEWKSEARGRAHVHCVIIGFCSGAWPGVRTLFDYEDVRADPVPRRVDEINGYLVDFEPIYVTSRRDPIGHVPTARFGSMPNDGGALLLDNDEATDFRERDPVAAARFLREIISAREWLHGEHRWCLWLVDASAQDVRSSRVIRERVESVRAHRQASSRAPTRRLAESPQLFGEIRQPEADYLCIPRHAGESRRIMPMAFFSAEMIASDSTITIAGADTYLFGVLQSAMFIAWIKTVGGRIKNDPRFSIEDGYNTFPFPDPDAARRTTVTDAAQSVLNVRASLAGRSLADMYDPLAMPPALVQAHDELDRAVDRMFAPRRHFAGESQRVRVLFERYMTLDRSGQLLPDQPPSQRPRRRRARA